LLTRIAAGNEAQRRGGGRDVRSRVLSFLKRGAVLLAAIAVTLIAVRIYDAQRGLPLEPWHTYAPPELSLDELQNADWSEYLRAEQAVLDEVRAEVTARLEARIGSRSTDTSRAARCTRAGSRRTGTGPT
jgi:hypothetical protein